MIIFIANNPKKSKGSAIKVDIKKGSTDEIV